MGNSHDHANSRTLDRRRLLWSLALIVVVFLAEAIGGLLSGSLALISDAGHMLSDAGAHVMSLVALLLVSRPADSRRTYGYYRMEILAALANGALLVAVGAFVLYSAYERLGSPPEIKTDIMIAVAGVGLGANLVSAWLLAGGRSLNLRGAYLHILSDLMSSVAVLVGGLVMMYTGGAAWLDPVLGAVIGVIVMASAFRLVKEAVHVLLEAVPSSIDLEQVRADVRELPGVDDVHDLHIWTLTSDHYALSAHLVVEAGTAQSTNDELLRCVNALLLDRHRIGHCTLQIESPDYEHKNPCD